MALSKDINCGIMCFSIFPDDCYEVEGDDNDDLDDDSDNVISEEEFEETIESIEVEDGKV